MPQLYNLACRLHVTAGDDRPERDLARAKAMEPGRRLLREDPATTVFSADHDDYLTRHFGRLEIEVIAHFVGHTETAVAYRARRLGLRRAARHWELAKVMDWLGVDGPTLRDWGVELHRCCDRRGRVRTILVESTDLARALVRGGCWQRLVARGADQFFIREIIESVLSVQKHGAPWERLWVSHGHVCLNPFSSPSFGLFYSGDDPKMTGADLDPSEISPEQIHLLR
ncbi:hypothetical protein [Miltoncostaea oceani]|uniref:hypothetical protein n=1 Tax=Miltoncostaea oceani TaxID=2843216 RepID=UPI001C3E862D|nr:hypothetical protein [Miltoncostaea oceani]